MAKNRPRTAATREQVEQARARSQGVPSAADPPGAPAEAKQPPETDPQGRLWADASPAPPAAPPRLSRRSGTAPRRADEAGDSRPRSRYAYIVSELERVAQLRQRYVDLTAAKKQAHNDWLEAAHNAAANGVKLQDIADECGVTRSGLYQTLSVWRREHRR